MGKGTAKRSEWRRKLERWAPVLEELERRHDNGLLIPDPATFVGEVEAGLSQGDLEQGVAVLRRFMRQQGDRWVVLPSQLQPVLRLIDDLRGAAEQAEAADRRRADRADASASTGAAGSAPPLVERGKTPPPRAASPAIVTHISYLCKVTLNEAAALLAECVSGQLPNVFSASFRKALSAGTWTVLVEHGLVVEDRHGDEVNTVPDATRFEPVRFVLVDEHKRGVERWQVLPEERREQRHTYGAWLVELRGYVERRKARLLREADVRTRVALPLTVVLERLGRLLNRVKVELVVVQQSFDTRLARAERNAARLRDVVDEATFKHDMRALEKELRELTALKASMPPLDEERLALEAAIERLSVPQRT